MGTIAYTPKTLDIQPTGQACILRTFGTITQSEYLPLSRKQKSDSAAGTCRQARPAAGPPRQTLRGAFTGAFSCSDQVPSNVS